MYFQPLTLDEAIALKARFRSKATLLAGGTDLSVLWNRGEARPVHVIDLSKVQELRRMRALEGCVELGGGVTFARCPRLPFRCLADAAMSIGGPGIREMGTLAGNIASASPAADAATALLALDADVCLKSISGCRWLPLSQFFLGYRSIALKDDEIISHLRVPHAPWSAWAKVGKRGSLNISVVAAGVSLSPQGEIRLAFASAGPSPMRCTLAEAYLAEKGLTPRSIPGAIDRVRRELRPISDQRASAEYRMHLAGVLTRRLLGELNPS